MADPMQHSDPDPELSLSGVVWSAVGIVVVTAVSMVLMWWMGGGLISHIESGQAPRTPSEVREAEAVRRAGEQRLESGPKPDLPGLAVPADYALPPEPRLETTLRGNIERLRAGETEVLDTWGWTDEAAGTVHVPIDQAIGLALAGALPGYPATAGDETGLGAGDGGQEVRDAP